MPGRPAEQGRSREASHVRDYFNRHPGTRAAVIRDLPGCRRHGTAFLQSSLSQMAAHARDGAILFTCMDWRHMGELLAAGDEVGLELKNLCVWNKDNGGMGSFYRSKHELVFAWKYGTAPHTNTFELGQHGRYRTNVWDYAGVNTMKSAR